MLIRLRRRLLICTISGFVAHACLAQSRSPAQRSRPLSPPLTTAITESLPNYDARSHSVAAAEAAAFELPKPKNGIIRLPRVVVEGHRPAVFTEREIYTDQGLAELAVKRYFNDTGLALNSFRLPLVGMTKEAYAMMLWQQDRRLGQIREFAAQATLDDALGEGERAAELRTLVHDTLGPKPLFRSPHRAAYRDARGQ